MFTQPYSLGGGGGGGVVFVFGFPHPHPNVTSNFTIFFVFILCYFIITHK
jgi:hypothetical protein